MAIVSKKELKEIPSISQNYCEEDIEEIDPRDDTLEGDRILGEAADLISKNSKTISKEEMYKKVGWM